MPTAADIQRDILNEVGAGLEGLPDTVLSCVLDKVTPFLPNYWANWAWKSQIYPGLQALYCKRQCLDIIMGQVRDLTNVTIGSATVTQSQMLQNLDMLHKKTSEEIQRVEKIANDSRSPAIAVTNQPPITQDALGRLYRTDQPPYPAPMPPPDMYGRGW